MNNYFTNDNSNPSKDYYNRPPGMLSIALSLFFLVSFCYFIIHRAQSCEPILKDEQFLWSADNFVWTWQMLPFASASYIQL